MLRTSVVILLVPSYYWFVDFNKGKSLPFFSAVQSLVSLRFCSNVTSPLAADSTID